MPVPMDQWLERWFQEPTWSELFDRGKWAAPYDIDEKDDEYVMNVEVLGWDAKDLDVEVSGNRVAIHGKRTDESGDQKKSAWARRHAELSLELELPAEVDTSKASGEVKNGVLTIHLPKTEQARQRIRKIPVRA
jgi:HSP20 family protein